MTTNSRLLAGIPGSDELQFSTGSTPTERIRIQADGKVNILNNVKIGGLATDTPSDLLHLESASNPTIRLNESADPDSYTLLQFSANTQTIFSHYTSLGEGSPIIDINPIATDNVAQYIRLFRASNSSGTATFQIKDPGGTNNQHALQSSTLNSYLCAQGGDLGIGNTAPAAKLHVTNAGTGDSLRIDDAGTDATPFIIDVNGRMVQGHTEYLLNGSSATFEQHSNSNYSAVGAPNIAIANWSTNGAFAGGLAFHRSLSGTVGDETVTVGNNTDLGSIYWLATDGSGFLQAAEIIAEMDAAPAGSGVDMPGRLIFSTTAVGDTTPTERMRIKSDGDINILNDVKIGGTAGQTPALKLHVQVGSTDTNDGIFVSNGFKTIRSTPNLGSGSYTAISQAGDQGIIFTDSTQNTGTFVLAPWATGKVGMRMVANGNVTMSTNQVDLISDLLLLSNDPNSSTTTADAQGVALHFDPNGNGTTRSASIKSIQSSIGNYADLRFFTAPADAPAERIRIQADGKVNILNDVKIGGAAGDTPSAALEVYNPTLGTTAGDVKELLTLRTTSSNQQYLEFFALREAGSETDWTTAGTRIQSRIDSTYQSWIEFNGTAGDHSIAFGSGTDGGTTDPQAIPERMRIKSDGDINILNNVKIGGTAGQTPSAALEVVGDIFPGADSTYDLGSDSLKWSEIHGDFVNLVNYPSAGSMLNIGTHVNNGNDAELNFYKARGGTSTPTQITAGDDLAAIRFYGHDSSQFVEAAHIIVDSTINTGNLGAVLRLATGGTIEFNTGALATNAVTIDGSQNTTFKGEIRVPGKSGINWYESTGPVYETIKEYAYRVYPNSSIGDSDVYFDSGEAVHLFTITPGGSSRNYAINGSCTLTSSNSMETLYFELVVRANTLPNLTYSLNWWTHENAASGTISPIVWVEDDNSTTGGTIKFLIEFTGSAMHSFHTRYTVYQRGSYNDVTIIGEAGHRSSTVDSGYTEYTYEKSYSVDKSGNFYISGNVGINTTSPKEHLDVRGEIVQDLNRLIGGNLYYDNGATAFKFIGATGYGAYMKLSDNNNNFNIWGTTTDAATAGGADAATGTLQNLATYEHDNNNWLLYTAGTERMRIDSNGQVMIFGDTGTNVNSLDISYNSATGRATIQADSNGGSTSLAFGTSDSGTVAERMLINYDGGIDLTSSHNNNGTGHTQALFIDSNPVISGTFSVNYRHAGMFLDVDSSGTPTANASTGRFNSIGSYITNHTTAQNSYYSYGINVLNYHTGALTAGAADKAQHYGAYIQGQSDVASGNVNVVYGIDTRSYAGSSGSATTATYDNIYGIYTYAFKYDSVTTGTDLITGLYSQIGMDTNAGYIDSGVALYSYIGTTSTALRNSYGFFANMNQRRTGNYSTYNTMGVYVNWGGNVSGSTKYSWYSNGGASALSYFAGQIQASGAITENFSDERLKTNLGNITNALDKVKSLNGFYYRPNALGQSFGYKDEMCVGLSAQQVEKILPEVVKLAPFDCATQYVDGNPVSESGENYKTIQYNKLIPLLIEAIKEQDEKINRLESMVEQLLNKKETL